MTIRIARHLAPTLTVLAASWASAGCGETGTTTVPANTPPPQMTKDGKPMPPPTAAAPQPNGSPAAP